MTLWIEEELPRVEKERKPTLREKWEKPFNGWQKDNVPKETCAVSPMIRYLETDTRLKGGKGQSSSPAPDTKDKTVGQHPFKRTGSREQSPWEGRDRFNCRNKNSEDPSCDYWHPLACENYKSETGCICGKKCHFRHVAAEEKPCKKSKKGGAKGSVAILKEFLQLGCVS